MHSRTNNRDKLKCIRWWWYVGACVVFVLFWVRRGEYHVAVLYDGEFTLTNVENGIFLLQNGICCCFLLAILVDKSVSWKSIYILHGFAFMLDLFLMFFSWCASTVVFVAYTSRCGSVGVVFCLHSSYLDLNFMHNNFPCAIYLCVDFGLIFTLNAVLFSVLFSNRVMRVLQCFYCMANKL